METDGIFGLTFGATDLTVVALVAIVVWQGLASWRAARLASRDDAYHRLAESMTEALRRIEDRQLHVLAALARQPSHLTRDIRAKRPVLQMYLRKSEVAGRDGAKVINLYDIEPFASKRDAMASDEKSK